MALRSLKDRLQKLEAKQPEHVGGEHSVENSATYEFTDWTSEIGRIQRGGSRPADWLELIQSVETGTFTNGRAQQLYISNLCAEALKSIPDQEKKTLPYANLLIHCASLRGQQSIEDAREMFQDARYDAKKFAIVHIAAAQFELSLGNRDKAKKILDRAKSLHAEPLTLVTKAFTNLVYGHSQLLDQEELQAQEKENNPPSRKTDVSGHLLVAKHSKDGFNGGGGGHTFSRDLTNIAHMLPKENSSSKGGYLLAKLSRESGHHGNPGQGMRSDNNNGEVLSRTAVKEPLSTLPEVVGEIPVRTHRLSESSDDSSNLSMKHVFKPPRHPASNTSSSWKFKTPVSEQKPTLAADKDRQTGMDDSVIAFNFKRERNTSGNASDDTDSVPAPKDATHTSSRPEVDVITSSSKKLRSYHSTPDCKKSSFLSMPTGSSTGHLFSKKKLNIGKAQRVKRTSLPQVTEGGDNSEDEDSLRIKPLPKYSPEKTTEPASHKAGCADSDSEIFAGIENLTRDILAFVEEPSNKMETHESKLPVSMDLNHNGDSSLEPHQKGSTSSRHDSESSHHEELKHHDISHDSSGPSCHGDSGYKSSEAEHVLEQKPSCKHNKSVMDASQGTLLGTAEFCPQSGTLVAPQSHLEVQRSKVASESEAGNNVQVKAKSGESDVKDNGSHAGHGKVPQDQMSRSNGEGQGENKSPLVNSQSCPQQSAKVAPLPQQPAPSNPIPVVAAAAPVPMVTEQQMQQQQLMMMSQMQNTQKLMGIKGKFYTIIRQMGSGGSSKVYEVQDHEFNRLAVKCVNFDGADEFTIESYRNEIELLHRLQYSKAVIRLYDYEYKDSDNTLYVVMEKGERDLANFFRSRIKEGNMSQELLNYYWKEMLRAVQVLHKEGIVHSDLKPANFLIVSGELKLIDFGIAKAIQPDMTSVTRETQVGTLNYMSPEAILDTCGEMQRDAQGRPKSRFKIGVKSDVWSLGCILHFLAYKKTPFQHITNPMLKLNAITNDSVEIVLQPHENKEIMSVIKKCLLRDPKKRPSIAELLETPLLFTKT